MLTWVGFMIVDEGMDNKVADSEAVDDRADTVNMPNDAVS